MLAETDVLDNSFVFMYLKIAFCPTEKTPYDAVPNLDKAEMIHCL